MTNIFDIARLAGVSKTTVSRVINNRSGVKEETRVKVNEAIEELNYIPNQAARSLVSRKSGVIGVIYNVFNASVYLNLANLLEKYAAQYNYNVVFCSTNDDCGSKLRYVQYFTSGAADGLILFGSDCRDAEVVQKIRDSKYPLVVIENYFNDIKVNDIIIDNYNGAKKAVQYLIELGHTKIAHITGNVSHKVAFERLSGYKAALRENGIEYRDEYVVFTDAGERSGSEAIEKIIFLNDPPTAVFTFNDMQGYDAIQKTREVGVHVPQDMSIIGFDNIYEVMHYIPSSIRLTSMMQPIDKIAESAIRLIMENIESREAEPKVISFDTELYYGESCSNRELSCED
ncbi:LacI family transcriptional regulator [Ruminiclostridium sufflavum DSM 19573]|uniref:LacI family transcriptional regulator n=1 Tax=Ruminiclostridium sufflavum DSM 19573 TaxID=1121337 RepID=A0A318XPD1_9FIRM|nr:LacI family DNA-binding transcriptional regulator [Ruminiclostridium sufflavum]PYG88800.1 LacI family transcriptional regulator [Ruminiclostridium sufflavum DSM 19573]